MGLDKVRQQTEKTRKNPIGTFPYMEYDSHSPENASGI